jgi:serine/threonine-protein kinase HipA
MPLASSGHDAEIVEPFLSNLLPDNQNVLERWARQFGVSARNPFALLAHVGEDLPGAIQVVRLERVAELQGDGPPEVSWLTETEIAERLRALRSDAAASRLPRDSGQFSLPGTQPKTALLHRNGQWGVPRGRTPTTHILKPPVGEWAEFAENEHFCLRLARQLGLPATDSRVQKFDGERAIVITRYDRIDLGDRIVRVHQEDLCQSLGVHPTAKYQNEGGPGVREVVQLLRDYSSNSLEDVNTFLDTLTLNWLIAGTDAHAKNFSVLLGTDGKVRLAPLYDLISRIPYDPWHPYELRLAMKIGGEYVLGRIHPSEWERLADDLGIGRKETLARVQAIAEALPEVLMRTADEVRAEGIMGETIDRLVRRALSRASREAGVFREATRNLRSSVTAD